MSGTRDWLTFAMPKGRIFEEAVSLLRQAGIPIPVELETDNRKLIVQIPEVGFSFFLAKPMDVAAYVEYGVADLGIVGKDVLLEVKRDVYELLDLQISPCRISVAGKPDWEMPLYPRVASKYPNVAERYFREKGQQVEVIQLNGSIELAPLIGLADRIVDIVSTGQTLRENGLVELEHITDVTSRFIANPASYRMKKEQIYPLYDQLAKQMKGSVGS